MWHTADEFVDNNNNGSSSGNSNNNTNIVNSTNGNGLEKDKQFCDISIILSEPYSVFI